MITCFAVGQCILSRVKNAIVQSVSHQNIQQKQRERSTHVQLKTTFSKLIPHQQNQNNGGRLDYMD